MPKVSKSEIAFMKSQLAERIAYIDKERAELAKFLDLTSNGCIRHLLDLAFEAGKAKERLERAEREHREDQAVGVHPDNAGDLSHLDGLSF